MVAILLIVAYSCIHPSAETITNADSFREST